MWDSYGVRCSLAMRSMILSNGSRTSVSPQEGFLKHRLPGPTSRVSCSEVVRGAWEVELLTSSQVILLLVIWGPHFENHWKKSSELIERNPSSSAGGFRHLDIEQLIHLTLNTSKQNSWFLHLPTPAKLFFPSHLMVPTFTKFLRPQILMSLFVSFPSCHIQFISKSCWLFRYIPNLSTHHFYPYCHGPVWVLSCLDYCCSLLIGFPASLLALYRPLICP